METKEILIVDDSATSRMIIKRCFQIAGFQESSFNEVEDGLKAMAFLDENTVDLIVTDLKMPKMDGNTFIKKIKIHPKTKNIPIIVISSMGNDVIEEELTKLGVKAVIKKPVSPAKLMEVLGE